MASSDGVADADCEYRFPEIPRFDDITGTRCVADQMEMMFQTAVWVTQWPKHPALQGAPNEFGMIATAISCCCRSTLSGRSEVF